MIRRLLAALRLTRRETPAARAQRVRAERDQRLRDRGIDPHDPTARPEETADS